MKVFKLFSGRAKTQALIAQLSEANAVIAFYASHTTYQREADSDVARSIVADDCCNIEGYSKYCGGCRARTYLDKYGYEKK